MHRFINGRALLVQMLLAIILAGVNVTSSPPKVIAAWILGFLLVSTALNVIITWSRHRAASSPHE